MGELYQTKVNSLTSSSKFEAPHDRSPSDLRLSHDLEDIRLALDGIVDPWRDIGNADLDVKNFLVASTAQLLERSDFSDMIAGTVAAVVPARGQSRVLTSPDIGLTLAAPVSTTGSLRCRAE